MEEEFEVITLTDENGKDVDFELVDAVEHDEKKYCILFPVGLTEEEREDVDPVILEYVLNGNEDYLEEIDEEEYDLIYGLYLNQ